MAFPYMYKEFPVDAYRRQIHVGVYCFQGILGEVTTNQ